MGHHVVGQHVSPGNDGKDDDHPENVTSLSCGGAVEGAVEPLRERDEGQPGQLPGNFEEQDRKHPYGVPQSQQCQDRQGHEHAHDGAFRQPPGVIRDQQRPLADGQADSHNEVADP